MDDLLKEFLSETYESLEVIDCELVKFEQETNNSQILDNIFRLMHTIKGTCGFLGLPRLQVLAHASESLMGKYREGMEVTPAGVTLILQSIDQIKVILATIDETEKEPDGDDADLIGKLEALAEGTAADDAPAPTAEAAEEEEAPAAEEIEEAPAPEAEIEQAEPEAEAEPKAEAEAEPEPAPKAIEKAPEPKPAPPKIEANTGTNEGSQTQNQSIRVNVELLEHLMNTVSELVLTRNQLLELERRTSDSEFKVPLQRLSTVTAELQDSVMKTRMQPIGNAWKKLPRIVRDLAQSLDKKIELVMTGAETELDRQVLEQIKDPLTHMVRNSADHGLETSEDREAAGKPRTGKITLAAYHEGGHIIIQISDDGKGLDPVAIKEKVVRNKLLTEAEADQLAPNQLYRYIFAPGFSTAAQVTSVSGRGVGMDVVRTNIELIGGTVDLDSEPGKGTTLTIKIPLTLAIVSALIVDVANSRFAIPQLSVMELVRVKNDSDLRIEKIKDNPVLRLRDELLPLIRLDEVLKLDRGETEIEPALELENEADEAETPQAEMPQAETLQAEAPQAETLQEESYIVVIQVGQQIFGIIVDGVYHTEEIVVKPMSSRLKHLQVFSGNTILGDGSVIMIIDPNGVAQHIRASDINRVQEEDTQRAAISENELQSLLLFHAASGDPKVVPLSLVTRLEEVEVDKIEYSDGRYVVQYRGALMPLVMISDEQKLKESGNQPLIVFSESGHSMGLIVDNLIDIVDDQLNIELGSERDGVLGAAVVKGAATEVVDIGYYLPIAHEDWFVLKDCPELAEKPRVLLIDDSPFFRDLLRPIIQSAGYRVASTGCAEEALTLIEQGEKFDMIVSDLEMGEMDGFAFAAELKSNPEFAEVPLIAIATVAGPSMIRKIHEAGFQDFVAKFDRSGLIAALKSMSEAYGDAA